MVALSFETTRRVLCDPGASAKLGPLMADLGVTRALLVTDPGGAKLGLFDAALDSLKSAGIGVVVYDQVIADPPEA
ncbi:iron-containing alcohol dehydrogenase, partial [Acinetobacter baumannii]